MKAIDRAIKACDEAQKVKPGQKAKAGFHNDPTQGMDKNDYINWLMSEKGYSKSEATRHANMFYE